MATDGNRATTARALKVPRLPGDIMICPMIAGLLINTFCPQVLEIGGFFTAATRGGPTRWSPRFSRAGSTSASAGADVVCFSVSV